MSSKWTKRWKWLGGSFGAGIFTLVGWVWSEHGSLATQVNANKTDIAQVKQTQEHRTNLVESIPVIAEKVSNIEKQSADNGRVLAELKVSGARMEQDIAWLKSRFEKLAEVPATQPNDIP